MSNLDSYSLLKLKELFFEKPLVLSQLIIKFYTRLDINEVELAVIIHLIRFKNCLGEDYPSIEDLQKLMTLNSEQIKATIAGLIEKGLINVEHHQCTNKNGKSSYSLNPLWERLFSLWENEMSKKESNQFKDTSSKLKKIYTTFEKEFGRLLSPIESAKIVHWCDNDGFSSELIVEALERAVLQGALSFKYIDSILNTWARNNIKSVEDILKYEQNYKRPRKQKDTLQKPSKEKDKFSELYLT